MSLQLTSKKKETVIPFCEAVVIRNKDLAIAALTVNPLVSSDRIAVEVFNDLFEAHKAYLPQFKEEINS